MRSQKPGSLCTSLIGAGGSRFLTIAVGLQFCRKDFFENMSLPDEKTVVFPHRRWLLIRQEYTITLSAAAKSSAVWFFCALVLVAILVLVLKDRIDIIR